MPSTAADPLSIELGLPSVPLTTLIVTEGWSAYHTPQAGYFERKREGLLVFRRPET